MKIVETAPAPNCRRVRIFLAEKGIEMSFEQINIMEKDQYRPEFEKLNAYQRVPVLVLDDGTCIAESIAICRYFEALHPEPALFGGLTRWTTGIIEMWQRRMELGLFLHIAQTFRHTNPKMGELESPQVPAWGEVNRGRAELALQRLDEALADRPFVAGEQYSVADITALVAIDFMKPAHIDRPAELIHLNRWYDAVSARPSAEA